MNTKALQEFTDNLHKAEIVANQIAALLSERMGVSVAETTWAHVGDSSRILGQLREILEQMEEIL